MKVMIEETDSFLFMQEITILRLNSDLIIDLSLNLNI